MCTALSLSLHEHYFGRTLDLDCSYGEEVVVLPRNFPLVFCRMGERASHFAMIGMATVIGDTPLFYDAVNEHGLAMAGLNFPNNAFYFSERTGKDNIAPFEFIPWILGQAASVREARVLLDRLLLIDISFAPSLPNSPLHWMIADDKEAVVVEETRDGLHIHENPVGVMTNNPPFPKQLRHLEGYANLRVDNGENADAIPPEDYCRGLGAIGLPGDVSSGSRFVRAAFGRVHAVAEPDEAAAISQFFHILGDVSMTRGICLADTGKWDITVYTSCMNTARGLYYYTTYDNSRIHCVDLHGTELDAVAISRYPLRTAPEIAYDNKA